MYQHCNCFSLQSWDPIEQWVVTSYSKSVWLPSRSKNTLWNLLLAFCGLSQHKKGSDPGFLIDVAIFQINLLFSERYRVVSLCAWLFQNKESNLSEMKGPGHDWVQTCVLFTTSTTLKQEQYFVRLSFPAHGKKYDAATGSSTFSPSVIFRQRQLWNKAALLHFSSVCSFLCQFGAEVRLYLHVLIGTQYFIPNGLTKDP